MLAHQAVHERKVAAEVAAGRNSFFDVKVIPSVAYTDPEVAWVGVTETEAKGIKYGKGVFPWAASLRHHRATGGRPHRRGGARHRDGRGPPGHRATIHPHPTLSETIGMAAEAFEGTITDLYMPKKR
jgi:dihydrolipoamide dehydrogenase